MLAYIYHTWILWDMEDIIFPTHFPCVFARGRRRKWCWSVCGRHWSTTPALASRRTRSAKWQGICLRKRWEIWNIMEYHGNIWENDGNSYEKISLNTHTHIYIYNIYIYRYSLSSFMDVFFRKFFGVSQSWTKPDLSSPEVWQRPQTNGPWVNRKVVLPSGKLT